MERRDFLKLCGATLAGAAASCGNNQASGTTVPPSIYIDPRSSGGSGTLDNPYGITEGLTAVEALHGDCAGLSILFPTDILARLPRGFLPGGVGGGPVAYNYKVSYHGTGEKPILCGSRIKSGTWTHYSGNVWTIPHDTWGSFYYGGQAADGKVTQANPYGTRLTDVSSLDKCLMRSLSQWYDKTANIYVNLGGANPNDEIMEYSYVRNVFHMNNARDGNLTLDGLKFCNGYDSNMYIVWATTGKATGLTITDVDSDQGGSLQAMTDKGNGQIIGPATAEGLPNFWMERFKSTNPLFSGLALLYIRGGMARNLEIDNAGIGLGLWNDVTDCDFERGKITNIVQEPDYLDFNGGGGYGNPSVSQFVPFGIYAAGEGQGANGNSYRNKISGFLVANCQRGPLSIGCGHGWQILNNTFIGGSQQISTDPANRVIDFTATGTGNNRCVQVEFCNNVIIADAAQNPTFMCIGAPTSHRVTGDKNQYYNIGGSSWRAFHYNSVSQGTGTAAFASYQAAVAPLDAHSTFTFDVTPTTLGMVNYGSYVRTVGQNANLQLQNTDPTPQRILNGYPADAAMVGFGKTPWQTLSAPPVLADADLSEVTGGMQPAIYDVMTTYITDNGETLASASRSKVITANLLGVASPPAQAGATGWNVYLRTGADPYVKQNSLPLTLGVAWTEPADGLLMPVISTSAANHSAAPAPTHPLSLMAPEGMNGEFFDYSSPDVGCIQSR